MTTFDYFATIQGGIGPDVWDKDIKISAVDFADAASQANNKAEHFGGQVVSLEQSSYQPDVDRFDRLTQSEQSLKEEVERLKAVVAHLDENRQQKIAAYQERDALREELHSIELDNVKLVEALKELVEQCLSACWSDKYPCIQKAQQALSTNSGKHS